jgi:hypothetical protein
MACSVKSKGFIRVNEEIRSNADVSSVTQNLVNQNKRNIISVDYLHLLGNERLIVI